jgi:hypothetical protein
MIDKNPRCLSNEALPDNFVTVKSCRFNHEQVRIGFTLYYRGDCPDFISNETPQKPSSKHLFTLQILILQAIHHDDDLDLIFFPHKVWHPFLTHVLTRNRRPAERRTPFFLSARSRPTPQPSPHTYTQESSPAGSRAEGSSNSARRPDHNP